MSTSLSLQHLRCEHLLDPLGIDALTPRLSWQLHSEKRSQRQTAYQILVASDLENLQADQGDLWDSGRVQDRNSVLIPYAGRPLGSRQRCCWKVRVWDAEGEVSDWSNAAAWEMGLLHSEDWQAQWIGLDWKLDAVHPQVMMPARLLRQRVLLPAEVVRARLYVSARGVYQASLNGVRVGDEELAPGWTDYDVRVQYQTHDVTALLHRGENVLGALLGDGWYCGHVGFLQVNRPNRHYGSVPQLLAQLEVELDNGERLLFTTSGDHGVWEATLDGPVRSSDMLMGEVYDARQELSGWDTPAWTVGEARWRPVQTFRGGVRLVADRAEPVRRVQTLPVQDVRPLGEDRYVLDFGQNLVGWVRLRVTGAAGQEVRLRFAEMLNPDGTLYTENLRYAQAEDRYLLRGEGEELWEPHFTFHGFRYAEVRGLGQAPTPGQLEAVVVASDTPFTGTFECSDEQINRLYSNIVWGQRDNFLSIPTDCPQRDERLGWLGDAQIFARTAAYNADVAAFFSKWMVDVADAQSPAGGFPDVAPRLTDTADGAPGWADAGVIIPWTLYLHYGDLGPAREHWDAMERFMQYLEEANPDHLWLNRRHHDFGDWLAQDGDDPENAFGSRTPREVLATAYWAMDAELMRRMALALGRLDDAAQYGQLHASVRSAFRAAYLEENGWIQGHTQTGQVLALRFGLLEDSERQAVTERLLEAIARKDGHLATGFLGVRELLPALSENGQVEAAYSLLQRESFPSWLYSVRQGATTIWERWDGWTEAAGFQNAGMNSFNHYSLGSVGEWLFKTVAGIDTATDDVGFATVLLRPQPGGTITAAQGRVLTPHGEVTSAWSVQKGIFQLEVNLPANTSARLTFPDGFQTGILEGGQPLSQVESFTVSSEFEIRLGSGRYLFTARESLAAGVKG
ncbi:family 78 glycoside hydrolase catalytic domain [Deinococcus altitudinis]|uniref:family 78 glycoside hydrolase catalytic domain n=1 Tax=Deinococcus altitudinis TaxID=468914 RepID=UPI003891E840